VSSTHAHSGMKVVLATSPHLNHAAFQEGIVPLASDRKHIAQTFVPMGLLSLAGAIQDRCHVRIADVNKAINDRAVPMSARFYSEAAAWHLSGDPDLVGFMTEADSYHHVVRICQEIKAQKPRVTTVLGGPHASVVSTETLLAFHSVDFVIRGEGEVALPQLLDGLNCGDQSTVGNLSYREAGNVEVNPTLPLIPDLDTLPWPDYSLIDLRDEDAIYLEIGRGCPFKCNFCFTAPYWQRRHRIKSADRILREIRHLKDTFGRRDFNFTHDLFTTDRRWVINFCRTLSDSALDITWTCSSRTDTLDEEQISWLKRAGCRNIYFGVETGTAAMQKAIDKNLDIEQARWIISKTAEAGIGVTVGFIAGLPSESRESLRGTLVEALWFLGLRDSTVHLFGYSPYKGSNIYERIRAALVPDPHFVDFPLGPRMHAENCSMMASLLSIFSRYSWPDNYLDLELSVVRAAEEFFPIVNALKPLFLRLVEHGVDPLGLLVTWSEWIAEQNRERQIIGGMYRGTIREFLEFLTVYVQTDHNIADTLQEQIRWEQFKDDLRTDDSQISALQRRSSDGEILRANPTIVLGEFRHAPEFRPHSKGSNPSTYAFYFRDSGAPEIAKIPPIALVVIELAKDGVTRTSLRDIISSETPPKKQLADSVEALIGEMERAALLI
jgi:tRNA A37 methylthiotransferase MiaB